DGGHGFCRRNSDPHRTVALPRYRHRAGPFGVPGHYSARPIHLPAWQSWRRSVMVADFLVYLGGTVLVLGAIFTLLATIGVLRLPDLYTRMHAASKAGAVGGGLILLAVALLSHDAAVSLRAVIGIAFLLLTTPISAHLLAK